MKFIILHETSHRLRLHLDGYERLSFIQADALEYYIKENENIQAVKVYDRTADIIIHYCDSVCDRENIIKALAVFSFETCSYDLPEETGRALNREYEDKLSMIIIKRILNKLFLPHPLQVAITAFNAVRFISSALISLKKGQLNVSVLDATAITASILRNDFDTASSVIFLLDVGEMIEEWTHKKSIDDLARTMSLNIEKVWLKDDDIEKLVSIKEATIGSKIIVRTGNAIPLDGKVISGEASVNQASMTGESLPVVKNTGSYAYAGTVVEEGELVIAVEKPYGKGKYDRIVKMIEESESLKSNVEGRAFHLADRLVPYTLLGTVLVYALTRNVTKALSVLMVDFSCAIKLSMPLTVLSAMRQASSHGITAKGGKFLELISEADTVVFDKTGTLTHATPKVVKVIPFGGREEDEMLRTAACLEEHYPHSIANAVVVAAKEKKLEHEEHHSKVEYVVAHGISSSINGEKVVIGSYHFVFDDEGCVVPIEEQDKISELSAEFTHLYMGISGELAAIICISDPLREEAVEVLEQLRLLGVKKTIMMTGDSERTAKKIAKEIGIDEYYSEVLPEDKANYIREEKAAGRKVIMIGDGINDSPALSEADVGIAISDGAAIAREIADIIISKDDLYTLVTLRKISMLMMNRINKNYRTIIGFNTLLLIMGVAGFISPATSALMHNLSTVGVSVHGMTNLKEK